MMRAARRLLLEILGWTLLLAGIAALVLPGPGLLMMFAGVAVLSRQYTWAERRLAPLKYRAMRGAAESVENWWRICASGLLAVGLIACGVLWIVGPPAPDWWPVDDRWWLPGGVATGITQIGSGLVALALIVWSYRAFHDNPRALVRLEEEITAADERSPLGDR